MNIRRVCAVAVVLASVLATQALAQTAGGEATGAPVAKTHIAVEPTTPRPPLVHPKKGEWPFKPWSYAKAYTYNFFLDTPNAKPLYAPDAAQWSPHVRSEHLLNAAQARDVTRLVGMTKGRYITSACPFPRHGAVLFDADDKPVASVEVCFSCEDVFAWPDFPISQQNKYADKSLRKAFDAALAGHKRLFGDELREPIDWRQDPQPGPPER